MAIKVTIKTEEMPWTHVLVTGGRGYIGRNLINHIRTVPVISCLAVDKKKKTYTENITDVHNFDGVIHLSAISGISECEEDKEQAYLDNIYSTISIMNTCYKYKKPLVFASSQAAKFPNNNFYAMTKWIGETEAKRLNKLGANIKMLRFSNVYGGVGWKNKTSVVSKFRQNHIANEPLVINGTGEQKRDFIHVDDLCSAIWAALICEKVCSDPIDIGTGEMVSVKEVAEMFTGAKIIYNKDSNLVGVMENKADTRLAEELLGFKSKISINKESVLFNSFCENIH